MSKEDRVGRSHRNDRGETLQGLRLTVRTWCVLSDLGPPEGSEQRGHDVVTGVEQKPVQQSR